jgi:hypothetical protein
VTPAHSYDGGDDDDDDYYYYLAQRENLQTSSVKNCSIYLITLP